MIERIRNTECWRLFWAFFRIGSFTFGGGYAMILLMQREVVDKNGWLSRDEFLELLALAQSAPGPIAVNTSLFVGYKVRGLRGALWTTLGTVIPPFVIILIIALFFTNIRSYPAVESVLKGMRPAVVALIAGGISSMIKGLGVWRIVLAVLGVALVWALGISPVYLIIAGVVGGYLYSLYQKPQTK